MAQWNSGIGSYLKDGTTLFEVFNVATIDGRQVTVDNPFPVSLGSSNITINGNVSIGATVNVASSPENPVHNHITEVGTTDILNVPYLPVGVGTVNLNLTYLPVGISSLLNTVAISNTSFYISGFGSSVSISNTSFYVTGIGGSVSIANTGFYVLNPVTNVTVGGTVSVANTVSSLIQVFMF